MPTYDYQCAACGHEVEVFQSIHEAALRKCPKCGKQKFERRIGPGAGFLFKGGGFYQTDYRSENYKRGESAEKGVSEPAATKDPTPAKGPGATEETSTASEKPKVAESGTPRKKKKD